MSATSQSPLAPDLDIFTRRLRRKAYLRAILKTAGGYAEACAREEGSFGELSVQRGTDAAGDNKSTISFVLCASLTDAELSRISTTVREILARKVAVPVAVAS